ncbi:SDR family oxidoreductase [Actinomyces sp. 594]|uniref:SDR family oxidoreductase n=1 Tax=Actinomyces sp. 594 TaxID=2057793 RepID=UPI001C59881F|nr:SDR family oxidoreductase [Actinomyces sp. 594]MBW3068197.1 SDR family oxidoreductase [Actinomyces sp. 594]
MSEQPHPSGGMLDGRTILVTGVLRPASIATAIAVACRAQGARLVMTGHPRTLRLSEAVARRYGGVHAIVPLDVTDPDSLACLAPRLQEAGVDQVDGVVHAIAHADAAVLGTLTRNRSDAGATVTDPGARGRALAEAFTASAASLQALVDAVRHLLSAHASVLALTFDTGHVHPGYGWMGPLKAALEASVRALAVELGPAGVRVNALSAGPLVTPASSAIPGMDTLAANWEDAAPLGWDRNDAEPVARTAVALLSDWLPATTGQVIHADGGAALRLTVGYPRDD